MSEFTATRVCRVEVTTGAGIISILSMTLVLRIKLKLKNIFVEAPDKYGFNLSILRLGIVCFRGGGPGLGDMIKGASKNCLYIKLRGKNSPIQLILVDDVIESCYNAIGKRGIFDIGAEDQMTLTIMDPNFKTE